MCTVSFVKSGEQFILTSNRDEHTRRPAAQQPQQYCINDKKIFFPKDPKAGGSWFAVDECANIAVLLNGAAQKHIEQPPYLRSRGLVLIDVISNTNPFDLWEIIPLEKIEPFTLILFQAGKLFQLRWNGQAKESIEMPVEENHIWSSVTLYPQKVREQREQWFNTFMASTKNVSGTDMQYFHLNCNKENTENGLVMNRNDTVKTFSVTQTVVEMNRVKLFHHDLHTGQETVNSFLII